MEATRTVTASRIPLDYQQYKLKRREVRLKKQRLMRRLERIQAEIKRRPSLDAVGVIDTPEEEVPRKRQRDSLLHLELPQWHLLPVPEFPKTVGAINLFRVDKKLALEVKSKVDGAVRKFLADKDKSTLCKKLDLLRHRCLARVDQRFQGLRKNGHFSGRKDYRINRLNNRSLIKIRFSTATSGISPLAEHSPSHEVEEALNNLVSFRDMERTVED